VTVTAGFSTVTNRLSREVLQEVLQNSTGVIVKEKIPPGILCP